jgi:hypothetical protein
MTILLAARLPIIAPSVPLRNKPCGQCGNTESPADTLVIDWAQQLICRTCVATHSWKHWHFDPINNSYTRL